MTLRFEQVVALQQLLETMEWREAVEDWDTENQRRIAETASFFLIGYCGSMRGFELPRALPTNLMHTIHLEERQRGHRHHVGIFFSVASRSAVMRRKRSWFSFCQSWIPVFNLACGLVV